jgi:hypothetical protein
MKQIPQNRQTKITVIPLNSKSSTPDLPSKVLGVIKYLLKIPAIKSALISAGSWLAEKTIKKLVIRKEKKSSNINNQLKRVKMEKGMVSKAAQDAGFDMLGKALVNQKPAVKVAIMLLAKTVVLVGDDIFADKLPEPLKEKSRAFFDALFVTKDYDSAIILGIDLISEIYDLVKAAKANKPVEVPK